MLFRNHALYVSMAISLATVVSPTIAKSAPTESTVILSCIEEVGEPFIHVSIEDRGDEGTFARVTENISEDGEQILVGDVRVQPHILSENVTTWRTGNNRFTLEIRTAASGEMTATLAYRHSEGRLFTDQLACTQD